MPADALALLGQVQQQHQLDYAGTPTATATDDADDLADGPTSPRAASQPDLQPVAQLWRQRGGCVRTMDVAAAAAVPYEVTEGLGGRPQEEEGEGILMVLERRVELPREGGQQWQQHQRQQQVQEAALVDPWS